MEQHPVPQHISSYEFHLIGDMTLRQFSMLAGAGIAIIITYVLPIAKIIKGPIVVSFGFLGVALAFLPIEERPLDQWLIAFIKSIYSPTQYLWKSDRPKPEFMNYQPPASVVKPTTERPTFQPQYREYLQSFPGRSSMSPLDQQEMAFYSKINQLFQQTSPVKVKKEVLPQEGELFLSKFGQTAAPAPLSQPLNASREYETPPPGGIKEGPPEVKLDKSGKRVVFARPISTQKTYSSAIISPFLPFPTAPTEPNIIVGMVVDYAGRIIENAIVEIRNSKGVPVRALKTNRLGQFKIVTTLDNGAYEIEVDKEPFEFDIIKIILEGKLILPIEIRAKKRGEESKFLS